MEKRNNKYRIHLQELELKTGTQASRNLSFDFENHDDIFEVIEKIKTRNLLSTEEQSVEFAVGLKLFSEILIRHKDKALFAELIPAIKEFMNKLKKS
ncbi:MAG: DUF3861 domain-containing protein [Candidatus Pseudobacter hemicellulosilyticus]|uniref:DUF3861 domain-containing protein n=1 Tax=Candidatus Pseudobacter hemicellulosilyticus TaxID=3121375 RepID=A0AAJ6BKA4_9BACT|nr:MAG: DUF3861 domain-containing protein [Pseudobacter sp.]